MSNVQLSKKESVVVYRDPSTRRILGFGPENIKPLFPAGTRYTTELCLHAADIERKVMEYRQQCHNDAEISTAIKLEAERPFRDSLRRAILERNNHVDRRNRDLNNALIKVWDHFYEKAINARRHAEVCLVAEKFDASKLATEIAMESPVFKRGDVKLG